MPHFEISRAFKEGKQLTMTQRTHALFAEEPVVGGYRLSRLAPPLKADVATFSRIWPQVSRLMAAHAIHVHAFKDGSDEKMNLQELLDRHKNAVEAGEQGLPPDPVVYMLERIGYQEKAEELEEDTPAAEPVTAHILAFLQARHYDFTQEEAQSFVDGMPLPAREAFYADAASWTPSETPVPPHNLGPVVEPTPEPLSPVAVQPEMTPATVTEQPLPPPPESKTSKGKKNK